MSRPVSRRALLQSASALAAAAPFTAPAAAAIRLPLPGKFPLLLFSKHLHWADFAESARVLKEIGAEGVDLTVRKGGHVEPAQVKEELPRAVEIFRSAGVPVGMLTTDIQTPESPHAREVLETAKRLGITHYRWADFRYAKDKQIPEQLAALKPRIHALAELNQSLGMTAMYHIHSGFDRVGTCVWDLWTLLREENPDAVAFNFDIGHATVEGGFGGWINSLRVALPYTRGTAAKDFVWERNAQGHWRPRWCPLGEGMVDWPGYFALLKQSAVPMPLQLHLEYEELGAAATGKKTLDMPKEKVIAMLKRDTQKLKELRAAAGLG